MTPPRLMLTLAGTAFLMIASGVSCSDDSGAAAAPPPAASPTVAAAPTTVKRPTKEIAKEALTEGYRTRAGYQAAIDKLGQVAPFVAAHKAESARIDAWKRVYEANGLDVPPDIFAGRIAAPVSLQKACAESVDSEKAYIALYDRLLKETTDAEALKVLAEHRKVSQETNLPAFEKCAQ